MSSARSLRGALGEVGEFRRIGLSVNEDRPAGLAQDIGQHAAEFLIRILKDFQHPW